MFHILSFPFCSYFGIPGILVFVSEEHCASFCIVLY